MKVLFIILCIVLYVIIGVLAGMIAVYIDKKNGSFDPDSNNNVYYISMTVFWPMALALFIIIYPFVKLYDFLMWFGKNINDNNDNDE